MNGDLPNDTFYLADRDQWLRFYRDNGYAVIRYISRDQAAEYLDRAWGLMEELSGGKVSRDDILTRTSSNYPYVMHGGMIQYLGHSQLQWDARAAVAPIYSAIYQIPVDQLSSSFDGLCFMDSARKYRARSPISFIHVDQSPARQYEYSVQGFLNLTDCGPDDGGLVLIPGSHTNTEYWDNHPAKKQTADWYLFTDDEKKNDPIFNEYIKVNCAPGDFVIWDSRTWHCNTTPKDINVNSIRCVLYICMLPKTSIPPKMMKKRKQAAIDLRTSSHHPANFKLFAAPRWCADETIQIAKNISQRMILTPLQRSLADID